MKYLAALGLLVLSLETSAQELNNCAGVITNRPCNGSITPKPVTLSNDAQIRSKKSLILHDLTMKSLRAKREHEVDVDISKARDICNNASTAIDECRDAAQALDDRIEDRLTARALVEASRPDRKPDPRPTETASNTTEVVIINNVRVYRTPRGFPHDRPHHDGRHDHDRRDDHDRRHDHDRRNNSEIGRTLGEPWKPQEFVPPPPVPRPGRMKLPK